MRSTGSTPSGQLTGFLVRVDRRTHTAPRGDVPMADASTKEAVALMLNGERRMFDAPLTVAGLLALIGLDTRKVAVERNEEIVLRSAYGQTQLVSGDSLEIVHFIGGG
jgi:thiazole synthase/sulfur carrier protein